MLKKQAQEVGLRIAGMIEMKRLIVLLVCTISLAACGINRTNTELFTQIPTMEGADHPQAVELMKQYGCQSCHSIPGVPGREVDTGPNLENYAQRTYIAGNLRNTPENLIEWLRNPQAIEPHTAMPMLGLTEEQARIIAAYLYERT
jgi:cytochrome c1